MDRAVTGEREKSHESEVFHGEREVGTSGVQGEHEMGEGGERFQRCVMRRIYWVRYTLEKGVG